MTFSAARQSKFGPSVYSAREAHAQIILGATHSDFKRAGIFCPADRIRTLCLTRRCGLTEGFMCPVFVNSSMLAAIRRNAILPECRFSCALLNTFLEQLKGASQTGNIPTERVFAPTGFNTLRSLRQIMKCLLLFN